MLGSVYPVIRYMCNTYHTYQTKEQTGRFVGSNARLYSTQETENHTTKTGQLPIASRYTGKQKTKTKSDQPTQKLLSKHPIDTSNRKTQVLFVQNDKEQKQHQNRNRGETKSKQAASREREREIVCVCVCMWLPLATHPYSTERRIKESSTTHCQPPLYLFVYISFFYPLSFIPIFFFRFIFVIQSILIPCPR